MRAQLSRFEVVQAVNLEHALTCLAGSPERLTPLAGGTDLYVSLNAGSLAPGHWLDIWGLEELRGIREEDGHVVLGALTTYTELRRSELVGRLLPLLAEAAATVGAVAIQNRGTLGGNLANGSPAGDSLPVLLAYDAEVGLISKRGKRWVPFAQFYTGYRASVMAKDELVDQVRVPTAALESIRKARYVKIGTRSAQAISKVVAAFALGTDEGGSVNHCRIAYGSMAPTPVRVPAVESALVGHKLDGATIREALAALDGALRPIDDIRSTARYRRFVASRILERFLLEA
ncbi:MAG: xanthine dehydrogenase family protein subunit M [Candidatus Riflebacteria bacterium]|nr:xanthine dehydrogenase family protein subunit M [Candidatus Riflebacteria bacterium]